jgi:hypothetical protein
VLDAAAGAAILGSAAVELTGRLWPSAPGLARADALSAPLQRLHVTGSYGLFAVMTTTRPQVAIEGSDDGVTWREYGFRYQPGDVTRAPRWVAPHMPRLDWQMWFAALGEPTPWFESLLARLLEGSPDVLALFEENPFPAAPPRYVRALRYHYEATDLRTHRETGAWWTRTPAGIYFPACSL